MRRTWVLLLVCVAGCSSQGEPEGQQQFLRDPLSGMCMPVPAADARAPRFAGWEACANPCAGLDEAACTADARCAGVYRESHPARFASCEARVTTTPPQPPFCTSSADCAEDSHCSVEDGDCGPLPGCRIGEACPAVCAGLCLPDDGGPPPDPCAGLPEPVCVVALGCEPMYASPSCVCPDGSRDCACPAIVVYQGCRRAYQPAGCLRDEDCGDGARCTAPSECDDKPLCDGPAEQCPAVCTGICVGDDAGCVAAARNLVGLWTSPAGARAPFERHYRFSADGTFTVEDLVAPCPPEAVCVWSGIVVNRGRWALGGPAVRLEYERPLATMPGLSFTSPLAVKGCGDELVVIEPAAERTFRRVE